MGVPAPATISKASPIIGILFSYYNIIKLNGRNALTCTHELLKPFPNIGYVCLESAVFSEKSDAISGSSNKDIYMIGRDINDEVYLKYDVYTDGGIGYVKVIIINNHDYPIYFGYTFSKISPLPLSEPDCLPGGIEWE